MKQNAFDPPGNKPRRDDYTDIGALLCIASSAVTWRLLIDYAFPTLFQGVKAVQTLILS